MTKAKKVILWGHNDLLAQAMENFFSCEETWDVNRVPLEQGLPALVEEVLRIKPDLVVLCQEKLEGAGDPLVKLMEQRPELRLIVDQPQLTVITVTLENNVMQIYRKESITIRQVSDLLSVIEDRHFSEEPI
ncbi:MAG TPA: hypothetical protein VK897_17590 [Anaerolineales bacterium]|nr:hypothetical protein [Anaerolineales bacterium]